MKLPKLEILARELETIQKGQDKNLSDIIYHARNDNYPQKELIDELIKAELRFFAGKVASGYYLLKETNA